MLTAGLLFPASGCREKPIPQETVRVSFLEKDAPLDSTFRFLRSRGCQEDAIACFAAAVNCYNSVPLAFDLSRFPPAVGGDFTFQSVTQLVAALPYNLRHTPHAFELNCYDAVIVLTAGQLRSDLTPDDVFGVSLAPAMGTNDHLMVLPVSTARDAFMWSRAEWYQTVSKDFIPRSAINSRMNLTAALEACYVLPSSTQNKDLPAKVLETLRVNWNRQRIVFPRTCEVVLCQEVRNKRNIITFHAGLLFKRAGGYTYLEKDSGCGPFVRLDFEAESALLPWLAAKSDAQEPEGTSDFFVTFNHSRIEELTVNQSSGARSANLSSEPNQHPQPTPQ